MKTYEGMFLLDAGGSDFEAASEPIREVLARAEADVVSMKPWDDRRLAYEIEGRRRGLYVLAYFKVEPGKLDSIQHDIQLSEQILRVMILSADHFSEDKIGAETPATLAMARKAAREAEKAAAREAEKAPTPAAETPAGDATEAGATPDEAEAPAAKAAEPPAQPEAEPETAPKAEPEAAPETAPETAPEAEPEAKPDEPQDEPTPEAAPEDEPPQDKTDQAQS